MKCFICCCNINYGEYIVWGGTMVCCGAGESDCKYSSDSESFQYVMHTSCLESLTEARKTPNKAIIESVVIVPECSTEEFVVQRSDALSMFDL